AFYRRECTVNIDVQISVGTQNERGERNVLELLRFRLYHLRQFGTRLFLYRRNERCRRELGFRQNFGRQSATVKLDGFARDLRNEIVDDRIDIDKPVERLFVAGSRRINDKSYRI